MLDRARGTARTVCASLMLAALLAFAVACGSEDEVPPTLTREAVGATPARTSTAEPATSVPTSTPVATSTPVPAPLAQPDWAVRQELAEDKLYVLLEDGLSPDAYVMAADDPEALQFEHWDVAFAVDTDGDGRQEAIVLHFTGGAHCCSEYLIFGSGSDGVRLLDKFSLGNDAIADIEDLDGDAVPELIAFDDRLAYFADLSYADSPSLPLVLCRSAEGPYYDCTPDFPRFLRNDADDYEGRLQEAVAGQYSDEEMHSAALALYFSYLRLGMAEEGQRRVESLCPGCWQWLSQNGAAVEERLNAEQPWRE